MKKILALLIIIGFLIMVISAEGLESSVLSIAETFLFFSIGFAITFISCFIYNKKYNEDEYYEE